MQNPAAVLALAFGAAPSPQDPVTRLLHAQLPPACPSIVSLEAGDVDGDGDQDLVWATPLRVLFNDGLALFAAGPELAPASDADGRLALVDVDGDGDLDLGHGGAPARLYENDGHGSFAALSDFPASGAHEELAFGDLDGDGTLDALLGGKGAAQVLKGDGAGAFAPSTPPASPPGGALIVLLGDLDGDGDLDAYVGNGGATPLDTLYANDGTGILSDVSLQLPSTPVDTLGAAFGDLDVDGDLDLVRKYAYDPLRSYANDGASVFTLAPGQIEGAPSIGGDVDLGDVDGDGILDVVVAVEPTYELADGQSRLYQGDGGGGWVEVRYALPSLPLEDTTAVAFADFDRDGDVDLATGARLQQPRVLLGNGAAEFRDVSSFLPPSAHAAASVAAGDLNGDGRADILVGAGGAEPGRLYLGTSAGTFAVAPASLPSVGPAEVVRTLLGDLDGDLDLDGVWILSAASSAAVLALENQGGPGLFQSHSLGLVKKARDGELGDLDADGDLDVVVAGLDQSFTLLNDGQGDFPVQQDFSALQLVCLDLGDLDGDGALDAWTGPELGPQRAWVGDGQGALAFWQEPAPGLAHTGGDVALGDFDADGDLDAAVTGAPARLYRGQGGSFATEPLAALAGRVLAVDLDQDGDLDLAGTGGASALLKNDGTGAFAPAALFPAEQDFVPRALAAFDLDGDQDLDLAAAGAQDQILFNLRRELAWRRLPDAGEPLTLDVWGSGGAFFLLAWSPGLAELPLAPFGTLRLAPAGLKTLAAGALSPAGRATAEVPVPDLPGLAGLTVFTQGLVGAPLAFTRLEAVPLSGF